MRSRILFLFAASLLIACALDVSESKPQPIRPIMVDEIPITTTKPGITSTAAPSSTPTASATHSPSPQPSATSSPAPSATQAQAPETQRITFAPEAVSAHVEGKLDVERTYLLNARGGQIMTLYLDADALDTDFEVRGADGVLLFKKDSIFQPFWRGTLPRSQDYQITLQPVSYGKPFRLSITVNPRGVPTTWTTYELGDLGLWVDVPDDFALQLESSMYSFTWLPELLSLNYVDNQAWVRTNLREVGLTFGAIPELEACLQPHPAEIASEELVLDGIRYRVGVIESAGGGERSLFRQYRSADLGVCFELTSKINYTSMAIFAGMDVDIESYDAQALEARIHAILRTLRRSP
jgi:hypothetical protein